jgi:type II secretory pathway component PulF
MERMARISTGSLIKLCHRVGTAVRSGIDARRVWEMEERHASGSLKAALGLIRSRVGEGGQIAEAMHAQNGYFPPMFVQMVAVGEQTGKLDEVLLRLAEHYEHLTSMKRTFWFSIAWPLFELVFAVLVIGLVIAVTGWLNSRPGAEDVDLLGWGLTGTSGAIIWFMFVGLFATAIVGGVYALNRGWLGPKPVLVAMRIPILGKCFEAFALSRLTWALALALDSGMDARRAVELSIRAAQNPYYETSLARVTGGIRANKQFHESFRDAEVFPDDFLHQLEAAELAGATTESLLRLAKEYEGRARTAMNIITGIATVAVVALVFGIIIFAIFSMAMFYINTINDAVRMSEPGNF